MAIHSKNETLMCNPSSLGPVAMRWLDGIEEGSISSFKELTRAFEAHFVTCSKVPQPLDSLLSMTMREGETLKTYSDKYWEMFNEIGRNFDDVAVRTFKVGLPTKHNLRKSLTRKPVRSVCQLMDRIDEYKWVKEDQRQGKGKAKVVPQDRRDPKPDRYNNNQLWRDFTGHSRSTTMQDGGGPTKQHQSLHCQYHQERGHTTKDCRTLQSHLEQLAKAGKLRQFLYQPHRQSGQAGLGAQRDSPTRPPLGAISVILVAPGRTGSLRSRVCGSTLCNGLVPQSEKK
ncbi:uncharacterized protein LOC142644163 [Castanea sativa]|uniref:uncharacterized protein LOC142644163 n=1 Tax=Castanea sativa TaxID=21020 RepID=UPI003F64DEFA